MTTRYRITILGCRTNHAETREFEAILRSRGLQPASADEDADLEVVHTCTVTAKAGARSRQAIRRVRRRSDPQASAPAVFVTGCFAGSDPDAAAEAALGAPPNRTPAPDAGSQPEHQPVDRPSTLPIPKQTHQHPPHIGAMAVIPHDAGSNQPAHQASGTLNTRFTQALDGWLQTAKLTLNTLPNTNQTSTEPPIPTPSPGEIISLPVVFPAHPSRHIRAEIRIQDGCDAHCTFCIIPKIRPTLRSKSIADAVAEARALVALGHVEVVLRRIFLGAFGNPTALRRRQSAPGAPYLAELLDAVAAVPGLERLRISSMEPMDVTDELLDAMVANRGVVVPHLHLPLQSGSNAILRRMNRQYDADDYRAMLDRVESALTEHGLPPAITTDIICGFPGSTEDDFQATVAMAERASYLHIHAFPFSPRQGTAAARWKADMVPMDVRRRRVRDLMELEQRPGDGLADRFRRRLIGRTLRIVVEGPAELAEAGSRRRTTDAPAPPNHPVPPDHPDHPDWIVGRCDHHVRVRVRSNAPRGSILHVRADALDTDAIVATDVAASTITLPQLTG